MMWARLTLKPGGARPMTAKYCGSIGIEYQPATQAGKTILPLRDLDRRCTLGQTRKILDQRTTFGTRVSGRRRLRAMT